MDLLSPRLLMLLPAARLTDSTVHWAFPAAPLHSADSILQISNCYERPGERMILQIRTYAKARRLGLQLLSTDSSQCCDTLTAVSLVIHRQQALTRARSPPCTWTRPGENTSRNVEQEARAGRDARSPHLLGGLVPRVTVLGGTETSALIHDRWPRPVQ